MILTSLLENKSFRPDKNNLQEMNLYNALPGAYKWSDVIMMWYRNAYRTGHRNDSTYIATQLENVMAMLAQYESTVKKLKAAKRLRPTYDMPRPYGAEGTVEVNPLNLAGIRSFDGFRNLKKVLADELAGVPERDAADDRYFRLSPQDMSGIGIVDFDDRVVMWYTKGFDTTNRFIYRFWGVGRKDFRSALAEDDYGDPEVNSPYCTRVKKHWDDYSKENPEYRQFWFMRRVPGVEYRAGDLTDPAVYGAFAKSANSGPESICAMCGSYNDWCDRYDIDLMEAGLDIFDVTEGEPMEETEGDYGDALDFNGEYDSIVGLFTKNTTAKPPDFYPWKARSGKFKFIGMSGLQPNGYDPEKAFDGDMAMTQQDLFQFDEETRTVRTKFRLPARISGELQFKWSSKAALADDSWTLQDKYNGGRIIDIGKLVIESRDGMPQPALDFLVGAFRPTDFTFIDCRTGRYMELKLELAHFENIRNLVLSHVRVDSLDALPRKIPGNLELGGVVTGEAERVGKTVIDGLPGEVGGDLRLCLPQRKTDTSRLPYVDVRGNVILDGVVAEKPGSMFDGQYEPLDKYRKRVTDYNTGAATLIAYAEALRKHDTGKFKNGLFRHGEIDGNSAAVCRVFDGCTYMDKGWKYDVLFSGGRFYVYSAKRNRLVDVDDPANENAFADETITIHLGREGSTICSFGGLPGKIKELRLYIYAEPGHAAEQIDIPYDIRCDTLYISGLTQTSQQATKFPKRLYGEIAGKIKAEKNVQLYYLDMSEMPAISFNAEKLHIDECVFARFANIPNARTIDIRSSRCTDLTNIPEGAEIKIFQRFFMEYRRPQGGMYVQKLSGCPRNIKKITLSDDSCGRVYPGCGQYMLDYLNGTPYYANMEIQFGSNADRALKRIADAYMSGDRKYFNADMQFDVESERQLENLKESEEIEEYVGMFGRFLRG